MQIIPWELSLPAKVHPRYEGTRKPMFEVFEKQNTVARPVGGFGNSYAVEYAVRKAEEREHPAMRQAQQEAVDRGDTTVQVGMQLPSGMEIMNEDGLEYRDALFLEAMDDFVATKPNAEQDMRNFLQTE